MEFDLLSAIELTVCASVAISVLAVGFGENIGVRLRIAGGLTLWFVLVTILAATEVLTYQRGVGAPGLGVAVILPIVILSVSVLRSPTLRRALETIPLFTLIGVHAIRILRHYILDPLCGWPIAGTLCANRRLGRFYGWSCRRSGCMASL